MGYESLDGDRAGLKMATTMAQIAYAYLYDEYCEKNNLDMRDKSSGQQFATMLCQRLLDPNYQFPKYPA